MDSISLVQTEHISSLSTFLLVRFTTVGRISWHALQEKFFILFGSRSFHMAVQIFFAAPSVDVPPRLASVKSLLTMLYVDLTLNRPLALCSQKTESGTFLRLKGIWHMASAMKHGCVSGLGCGCGCGCGTRQFLKKVGAGAARLGD